MPRKRRINDNLVDSVAQNLFMALPIFRKRLLHMDVIQREFNIPLSHVQVMAMLHDNGSMNVSEISQRLGIAKPNITPLIDRLIAEGFAERRRDEQDHRMVNVSLGEQGEAHLLQIQARMRELVGDWATSLTIGELRALNDGLHAVTTILSKTLNPVPAKR